jgi:hypothetical protein
MKLIDKQKNSILDKLRDRHAKLLKDRTQQTIRIYTYPEDIERYSTYLSVQHFEVPAQLKDTLSQFSYSIPILGKSSCATFRGQLAYVVEQQVKKGIIDGKTKKRLHKFGSCVTSEEKLGVPTGLASLMTPEHDRTRWVVGGSDYSSWARMNSSCMEHTRFNEPRLRPPDTLPTPPFLVFTQDAVIPS